VAVNATAEVTEAETAVPNIALSLILLSGSFSPFS
jgi:hypothetical protein